MGSDWKVRGSTIYLLTLIVAMLGFTVPVGIQFIAPFIGLIFYYRLQKQGRIKKFDPWEIPLMLIYTFGVLIAAVIGELYVISSIPWLKIILVGMAADLIASTLGLIPFFGDIPSGILVFILVLTVIGGIQGILLGVALMIISFIPGPSFGANTLFLVIFKLISSLIFGWGVII